MENLSIIYTVILSSIILVFFSFFLIFLSYRIKRKIITAKLEIDKIKSETEKKILVTEARVLFLSTTRKGGRFTFKVTATSWDTSYVKKKLKRVYGCHVFIYRSCHIFIYRSIPKKYRKFVKSGIYSWLWGCFGFLAGPRVMTTPLRLQT